METFKTVEQAKQSLAPKMAELQETIDNSIYSFAVSRAAEKRLSEIFATKDMASITNKDELEDLFEKNKLIEASRQLGRYQDTIDADLMIVHESTKWLLAEPGDKLESPAGFHYEQRVFVRTRTAVQVSRLPRQSNLVAFRI